MPSSHSTRTPVLIFASLTLWLAAVLVTSASGLLGSLSPLAPPPIAALTILIPALCYWFVPSLRSWLGGIGLRRLTAVHILRIVAVPLFFWYGSRGLLQRPFVEAAGWGDLLSGLLAFVVVVFWPRTSGYWTVHIIGMLDFITAFATAIRLSMANPGAMHAITGLPMALIPFFGVGVLATIHVIAYDLLLRKGRAPAGRPLYGQTTEAV